MLPAIPNDSFLLQAQWLIVSLLGQNTVFPPYLCPALMSQWIWHFRWWFKCCNYSHWDVLSCKRPALCWQFANKYHQNVRLSLPWHFLSHNQFVLICRDLDRTIDIGIRSFNIDIIDSINKKNCLFNIIGIADYFMIKCEYYPYVLNNGHIWNLQCLGPIFMTPSI